MTFRITITKDEGSFELEVDRTKEFDVSDINRMMDNFFHNVNKDGVVVNHEIRLTKAEEHRRHKERVEL